MLSLLRRIQWGLQSQIPVKTPFAPPLPSSPLPMDSSIPSQRLVALAGQLRLYKTPSPPPSIGGGGEEKEDDKSKEMEDRSGKVVSQVGFPESSTSIGQTMKLVEAVNPKKAAVLVCLFEGVDGDLRVILTKRSSNLSTHSGEVALPGGKMDEGDRDEVDTATREAQEEIGLDPSLVNVVTILEPFLSKNILRVFPVIGILSDKEAFRPLPNADEVEAVFDAPLEMFLKDENRRVEEREWLGCKYQVHFFDYKTPNEKYIIWGLTAGILIRAASIVYGRQPPFSVQNLATELLGHIKNRDASNPST